MRKLLMMFAVLILAGCNKESSHKDLGPASAGNGGAVTFADVQSQVFAAGACLNCHSSSTAVLGGVNLDSESTIFATIGLVDAGNAGSSDLYKAVESGAMPPSGKLSDDRIAVLASWINSLPTQ